MSAHPMPSFYKSPPPISPFYKHLPNFTKHYDYTPINLEKIVDKVALLYALFLTREAHNENDLIYQKLQQKHLCLTTTGVKPPHLFPLLFFISKLRSGMLQALSSPNEFGDREALLHVDNGPDSPILEKAIEHMDYNQVGHLFPPHSTTAIKIKNGKIILNAYLECCFL